MIIIYGKSTKRKQFPYIIYTELFKEKLLHSVRRMVSAVFWTALVMVQSAHSPMEIRRREDSSSPYHRHSSIKLVYILTQSNCLGTSLSHVENYL